MADLGIPGGVRIVHTDKRLAGKTLVVPTARWFGGGPKQCNRCTPKTGRPLLPHEIVYHDRKHYHIRLDDECSAIVSHTVLEGLRQVGMAGFESESEVKDPPTIRARDVEPELPHKAKPVDGAAAESAPVGALTIG